MNLGIKGASGKGDKSHVLNYFIKTVILYVIRVLTRYKSRDIFEKVGVPHCIKIYTYQKLEMSFRAPDKRE